MRCVLRRPGRVLSGCATTAALALLTGGMILVAPARHAGAVAGAWENIDRNPATRSVVALDDGVAQLQASGQIYQYAGVHPAWQLLDNNPATRKIVGSGRQLYQLHQDGTLWRYTGTPLSGWQLLDSNPATVDIAADGDALYQLHNTGLIFRYTGVPISGWQLLDNNPAAVRIVTAGGHLYQRHRDGRVWTYTGLPLSGWQLLDSNPATVDIAADGDALYQLHNTGLIFRYTGVPISGWQLLDNNPAVRIIAAAGTLHQVHSDGKVWRYTGTPISGWRLLDSGPTRDVTVGGSFVYQVRADESIWRLALGRRMTSFDPARHGFGLINAFRTEPIQDVRVGGLCGGMTYAALDYWRRGLPVPNQTTVPATGSPLFNYLYSRQVQSILSNVDKWAELVVNPFGWRTDEFFNWGMQDFGGGRLQEIRQFIDAGQPVPLGLFKAGNAGIGPHHQVLAIGYDLGQYAGDLGAHQEDLKIFVADPNFPRQVQVLVPSPATHSYHYVDHADQVWLTYFVDANYQAQNPPAVNNPDPPASMINQVALEITTGGDDLRGGDDNVNVVIAGTSFAPRSFLNINNSARWISNYPQAVLLPLNPPVPVGALTSLTLTTTFGGGISGDNWNVDRLRISAGGTVLFDASGGPLVRFTGSNTPFFATLQR